MGAGRCRLVERPRRTSGVWVAIIGAVTDHFTHLHTSVLIQVNVTTLMSVVESAFMRGPRTRGRIHRCDQAAPVGALGKMRSKHRMTD
jgi:hypothetical protein